LEEGEEIRRLYEKGKGVELEVSGGFGGMGRRDWVSAEG